MKKYNPHSNRTRSRLVPAPKSQKPLIVAAGTIRAGTVLTNRYTKKRDRNVLMQACLVAMINCMYHC